MKCLIPGRFVKLFGRAIHCLSKIGDELYIEATEDGLALRTVNSSRSAFGCFLFNESFFHEYTCDAVDIESDEDAQRFKLSMKSCLGAFKSLSTLEKNVDTCKLEYDDKETRLVFKLFCRHGITKTHNLTFQESESLQAVFSKELCPNQMTAKAKVLVDTASNFPNNCEEVTLSCTPESIMFKNYLEDEPDPSTIVHTEMKLHPEEFDNYRIGVDTNITFCLKETRAVLSFADFVCQPVCIHFSTCGKPVVFSIDGDSLYEADFVLATLMDQPLSSQGGQQNQTLAEDEHSAFNMRISNNNRFANRKKRKDKLASGRGLSAANYLDNPDETGVGNVCEDVTTEDDIACPAKVPTSPCAISGVDTDNGKGNLKKGYPPRNDDDDFFSESFPYKEVFENIKSARDTVGTEKMDINTMQLGNSERSSQVNAASSAMVDLPCVGDISNEAEEVPENFLIATPPTKRFKSIFFGTVTYPREVRRKRDLHETVLAADTDDES